ncbi:anthocyanidin-3-O-glucoside rhamnosyltransferase-like [Tasmannia lanceolata]|uniref:anthocyanidin-3-O-glucoside rhamnosyltransferase-like n=1 Tax=Tasmannia lanceolata TaxID=3420 RepID=UPI004063D5A7
MESNGESLHVAMFPWFAFGHISPFIQLSNKLFSHGIKVSFLSPPSNIQRISSSLQSQIQIIPLQIPPVEGLPPGIESTAEMTPHMAELLKTALDAMKPQISTLLSQLKPHIIFHDFTHQWLPSLASPLGIKTLFYSVFAALPGAYLINPARLLTSSNNIEDPECCFPCTHDDHQNLSPSKIPTIEDLKRPPLGFPCDSSITSLKNFEARDLTYVFMRFGGPSVFERGIACQKNCSAMVIKSCLEMEAPYIKFIETQFGKPVLVTGPVVPEPNPAKLDQRWDEWLGAFDPKSIVFCSFGSETFLEDEQIRELVLGLEMVGLPFLVVLNFPGGEDGGARLKAALPEGFEERVKEKGRVHTGWVQQQQILAHQSVGCFVCHAGLSSITEGLVNDCQLVLLAQKGDQYLNSKLVSGDWKAGVEVKRNEEDGSFFKEDLCEAVRSVMVGGEEEPCKSVRANQKKWKDFLLDKETQDKFTRDFVAKLKEMVFK